MAAHVAMRCELKLGGLIVLSGWIAQMNSYPSALSAHRCDVLWCHGDDDAMIQIGFATMCVNALQSWGLRATLETLRTGHCITNDELTTAATWLQERVCGFTPSSVPDDGRVSGADDELGDCAVPAHEPSDEDLQVATEKKIAASEAMSNGNYESAVQLFSQAIAKAGSCASPLVFANRAVALMKLTPPKVKAAIRDCTRALNLNPDSAKALKTRGKAYSLLGKWEQAVKDLRIGQQIDYDEASAQVARQAEKQYAEAMNNTTKEPAAEAPLPEPRVPPEPSPAPAPAAESGNAPIPAEFMQNLLGDPELMSAMQNPEIAPKLQDIVTAVMNNPMQAMGTVMEYVNDPKLGPLIMKLMGKFETKTKWTSIDEVD